MKKALSAARKALESAEIERSEHQKKFDDIIADERAKSVEEITRLTDALKRNEEAVSEAKRWKDEQLVS